MEKSKLVLTIGLIVISAVIASADEDPIGSAVEGCRTELETYCSSVTPGESRLLACLYAHGDKLSGRCEYALYDAAAQLQRIIAAVAYVASECDEDLAAHCSAVTLGEGRVASCLLDHKEEVSQRCSQAIDEVELEVE